MGGKDYKINVTSPFVFVFLLFLWYGILKATLPKQIYHFNENDPSNQEYKSYKDVSFCSLLPHLCDLILKPMFYKFIWVDLPTSCHLYILLNTTLYTVLITLLYNVLCTAMCTVLYTILYTITDKDVQWLTEMT